MAHVEIHLDDTNKFESNGNMKMLTAVKYLRNVTGKSAASAKGDVDDMIHRLVCIDVVISDSTNLTTNKDILALRGMGFFVKGMSDYHIYKELLQPIIDKAIVEDRMSAATHLIEALKDIKANKD